MHRRLAAYGPAMWIRFSSIAAVVGGFVAALAPRPAAACACCGSHETAAVVGWSASGRAVAIRRQTEATCNRKEVLEIWKVGERSPSECYDAYGEDPAIPVACAKIEGVDPNWPIVPRPAALALPGDFTPAAPISERYLTAYARAHPESDEYTEHVGISLAVYVPATDGGRFHEVDASTYDAIVSAGASATSLSVWPAHVGRAAALLVDQDRYDDEFEVAVVWVKLPRRFDRSVVGSTGEAIALSAAPVAPDPGDAGDAPHTAARLIARGRVYERIGQRKRALELYDDATSTDPSSTTAWIASARMLVAHDRPERGLAMLERLDALPCSACREELRGALRHADFAVLREFVAFAKLGGQP